MENDVFTSLISLSCFSAENFDDPVMLSWLTQQEKSVAIERSWDNTNWHSIKTFFTPDNNGYEVYIDHIVVLSTTKVYYRLKSFDDGIFEYSTIKELDMDQRLTNMIVID